MSTVAVQNVSALFALVQQRINNFPVPSNDIATLIQSSISKNFRLKGRYDPSMPPDDILSGGDSKWKDLAASTKRAYKKKGWKLETTLSRTGGGLMANILVQARGNIITISANKKYAQIHQYGGEIKHPGGTPYIVTDKGVRFMRKDGDYPEGVKFTGPHTIVIPARPFIVLQREDLEDIRDLIAGKSLI